MCVFGKHKLMKTSHVSAPSIEQSLPFERGEFDLGVINVAVLNSVYIWHTAFKKKNIVSIGRQRSRGRKIKWNINIRRVCSSVVERKTRDGMFAGSIPGRNGRFF